MLQDPNGLIIITYELIKGAGVSIKTFLLDFRGSTN
jgi:hypothetical protein